MLYAWPAESPRRERWTIPPLMKLTGVMLTTRSNPGTAPSWTQPFTMRDRKSCVLPFPLRPSATAKPGR